MIYSEDKGAIRPDDIEHVIVYRRNDEYAGWPFNGGFWHFGNGELLVGFNRNKCSYMSPNDVRHSRIQMGDGQLVMMRSKDGEKHGPLRIFKYL
jgi:hypothetical protein